MHLSQNYVQIEIECNKALKQKQEGSFMFVYKPFSPAWKWAFTALIAIAKLSLLVTSNGITWSHGDPNAFSLSLDLLLTSFTPAKTRNPMDAKWVEIWDPIKVSAAVTKMVFDPVGTLLRPTSFFRMKIKILLATNTITNNCRIKTRRSWSSIFVLSSIRPQLSQEVTLWIVYGLLVLYDFMRAD